MFDRFNEKAIKAVMMASDESRRLGHNFVSTEMLLVGIVAQDSGVSGRAMKKLGITVKDARRATEELLGRGSDSVNTNVPFTPAAKRLLADSIKEAKKFSTNTVDTSHILLTIFRQSEESVTGFCDKLSIDP